MSVTLIFKYPNGTERTLKDVSPSDASVLFAQMSGMEVHEIKPEPETHPKPAQADATKRWTLHKSFPSERYAQCDRTYFPSVDCEYRIHVEVVPRAAMEQQAREFCETLDMIRRRAEQAEARQCLTPQVHDAYEELLKRYDNAEVRLKEAAGLLRGVDAELSPVERVVLLALLDREGGA